MQGIAQHKKGSISAHGVSDLPLVVSIAKGAMICSAAPALPAFIATAKWFCNCSGSLRPADCVVKPRRCAASPAFYALSTELTKTDHFTKPLRGGYTVAASDIFSKPELPKDVGF